MKTKEEIKNAYVRACNDYLYRLIENWELFDDDEPDFGWWVGEEVGGVYCFYDDMFIGMNDIVYCVDNDVDYGTYADYLEYSVKCQEYGFDQINLTAFVKGAPRVSKEEFEKLDGIKHELFDSIECIKQLNKNLNNNNFFSTLFKTS